MPIEPGLRPAEEVFVGPHPPTPQNRDVGHPMVVQTQAIRDLAALVTRYGPQAPLMET